MAKYYTMHSNAHDNLDKASEPMSDGMKITIFCNRLKDSVAINYAITSKTEAGVATFEDFYNSFSAKLTSHITLINVGKPVFQDEDMSKTTDVKKMYADMVKSRSSECVHVDSSKKHLPQNSNKAIKQQTTTT